MKARTALALLIPVAASCANHARATSGVKRGIQGVTTGMTIDQAWEAAIKNGGRCNKFVAQPAFSCRFDRLTLLAEKTIFIQPPRVTSLSATFEPSRMGVDLSHYMKEQFDLVRELDADGHPLPWRPLETGETVRASCSDNVPGNIPSPLRCTVTLTDGRLIAVDRHSNVRGKPSTK